MINLNELSGTKNVSITIDADELMRFFEEVQKRMTVPEPEEKLLTVEEVCRMAHVSRPTLHRWKTRGLIKEVKIGKSVRFRRSEVENFLAGKR